MTLGSCSNQPFPQGPSLDDQPEPSSSRPTKRQRMSNVGNSSVAVDDGANLDADDADIRLNEAREERSHDSGLTSSLPPVPALEASNVSSTLEDDRRLYTSSLYTDAFNLALDTVLAEECHLFSEKEAEIFQKYRSLPYEAQYLYVRLFLRKSTTWFRIHKLGYHSDIPDMHAACSTLWSPEIGFAEKHDIIESLDEATSLLTLEELKVIGKDEKFTGCTTKTQFITAIKKAATSQGRLQGKGWLSISFDGKGEKYIKKILEITGDSHPLNELYIENKKLEDKFYAHTISSRCEP